MAIPESTIKKSGETSQNDTVNHQHTIDVNVLRRQRQQAFREVGFAAVAEQKAVNGYSAIITPSSAVYPANTTASDSCLSTPLIDISNLGGSSDNLDEDRGQKQHPLHHAESNPMFLSPEAGLHRDGEQARLVELVRRRQLQQQQNYEENTLQWLEESAAQLWESILIFGGMMEDPHIRSPHSTMPVNPYRDNSRSTLDNTKSNHEQNGNMLPSSDSKKNDHPTSQPLIIMDGPPSSPSSPLSRHRRVIRFVFHTPLRILYAFRWSIDFCITRLACLEPLLPNASSSTYSTSPVYSLHVTTDDILRSLIILLVFFYCIFRMQVFAGPMVIMMCVFIGSVSRKVVGRAQSLGNQPQIQQVQQQNATQSITGKETTISTIQPKYGTPNESIATNDQLHARAIQRLQKQFPNSTRAECKRFFTCVKYKEGAASKRIDEFLKWRSDCGLKTIAEAGGRGSAKDAALQIGRNDRRFDQTFAKKDEDDWNAAAKVAMFIITKSHDTESVATLPQIICSYEEKLEEEGIDTDNAQIEKPSRPPPRCKDGTRILHIMVARVDLSLATAPTYSLAAALYLDRRLSRSTAERITLVSDVRGGRGWANPTPWSMLPFVQSTASLLGSHYPERLERLVLFPMPKSAIWVWSAAQKCLDPNTSSKVVVVSSGEGSGLPERMSDFFAEESLNVLEERRRSFFVGSS